MIIYLKDKSGNDIPYENVETITFDSDVEGGLATFTYGNAETKTVELQMVDGDMCIVADDGTLLKEITILKPDTLVAENIKIGTLIGGVEGTFIGDGVTKKIELDFSKGDMEVPADKGTVIGLVKIEKPSDLESNNIISGVNIAGIEGAYTAPKLNAPSAVTWTEGSATTSAYVRFTNPTSTNGTYPDRVQLCTKSGEILGENTMSGTYGYIYSSNLTSETAYWTNAYGRFLGTGFAPSDIGPSSSSAYIAYSGFKYELEHITVNNPLSHLFVSESKTITLVPDEGYYLPKEIYRRSAEENSENQTMSSYNPETGKFVLEAGFGNYIIIASALDMPWVRTPTLSLSGTKLTMGSKNAERFLVSIDGTQVADLEKQAAIMSYSVETVSGAAYGFKYDSSTGYYVSENTNISSSYAITKLVITTNVQCTLVLDCINYGEGSYDYGILSNLDTMLTLSSAADSSGVYKSFSGSSSSNVVQVTYTIPAGTHFICAKYKKDGSVNNGTDTFRFKVNSLKSTVSVTTTFDFSEYTTNYGNYSLSVVGIAEGHTDSDASTVTYSSQPTISYSNGYISPNNIIDGVSSIDLYIDDNKVDTLEYEQGMSVLLEPYIEDIGAKHTVYIKAIGDGIAENQSSTFNGYVVVRPIYGVSGLGDSTVNLTRLNNAVGMTYTINSDGTITSDFDNVFPWNKADIVYDEYGNKFIQMPRMFFKVPNSWSYSANGTNWGYFVHQISVSEVPDNTGSWYEVEPFCYGCYKGYLNGTKLESKSGHQPSQTTTRANFRSYANNNGSGYHQTDLYHLTIMRFLWWIEFANKNSQAIMQGRVSGTGTAGGTTLVNTGGTDVLTTPSGIEPTYGQMRWHYIEDFVGNLMEWIDGVYANIYGTSGYSDYATADPTKFSDTTSGKSILSYKNPRSSGYNIHYIGWDPANPFLCTPMETVANTSYNTYFCDYYFKSTSTLPCVCYGSASNSTSSTVGLMYTYRYSSTATSSTVGSRLLYNGTFEVGPRYEIAQNETELTVTGFSSITQNGTEIEVE